MHLPHTPRSAPRKGKADSVPPLEPTSSLGGAADIPARGDGRLAHKLDSQSRKKSAKWASETREMVWRGGLALGKGARGQRDKGPGPGCPCCVGSGRPPRNRSSGCSTAGRASRDGLAERLLGLPSPQEARQRAQGTLHLGSSDEYTWCWG